MCLLHALLCIPLSPAPTPSDRTQCLRSGLGLAGLRGALCLKSSHQPPTPQPLTGTATVTSQAPLLSPGPCTLCSPSSQGDPCQTVRRSISLVLKTFPRLAILVLSQSLSPPRPQGSVILHLPPPCHAPSTFHAGCTGPPAVPRVSSTISTPGLCTGCSLHLEHSLSREPIYSFPKWLRCPQLKKPPLPILFMTPQTSHNTVFSTRAHSFLTMFTAPPPCPHHTYPAPHSHL